MQNAADATGPEGGGRVLVELVDGELCVANTGAPLTASGVAALAALRASAKRDDAASAGRFGVGFSAVLALSDAPRVISADGGVAFSAARTAEAVAGLAGPAAELVRRGTPPVLRLVWPTDEKPPPGYATQVRLPLRAGTDVDALLAAARAGAADLLLALPRVVEIDVAGTLVRRVDEPGVTTVGRRRWRLARATGLLDGAARDTAAEQRGRDHWSVTWAFPLDAPLGDDVAHAPTATAEPLSLPARLIATLPLEPDRRRVRSGPAADAVLDGATATYLDLVAATPPEERLALVPEPGFPRSPLDGALRERLTTALRRAVWLPAADGGELAPARAEWLDIPGARPRLSELAADAGCTALVRVPDQPFQAALGAVGVTRVGAATLVERLFGVERPGAWWRELYGELAEPAASVPGLIDELRALPVPLADGRSAAGPATVLLPGALFDAVALDTVALAAGGLDAVGLVSVLGLPGLHIADPAAVHPLLTRLGAEPADPAALLEHPALAEAVARSVDDAEAGLDVEPLAAAVLALVGEVGRAPAGFGALALPDADGRPARADELLLPDAVITPLLADDVPLDTVDPALVARVPRAALVAVGVLDGFAVVTDAEPAGPDHDLDDEDAWWDAVSDGIATPRLAGVRDLDLVADAAWPAALALLAGDRETRGAVLEPGSYAAWWLARHALLGGHRPGHWRLTSADGIATLYDAVPLDGVDEPFLTAIGLRAALVVDGLDTADDLLERLADPGRTPDAALTSAAHEALAEAVASGTVAAADLALPDHVRALDGSVASVDVAVVLDAPWCAAVLPAAELVIGGDPEALAELLDLPVATDVVAGDVEGAGTSTPWSALGEVVVACDTLGVAVPAGHVLLHDELWVALRRPDQERHRVACWPDGQGGWHAEDPVRALLALLADGATA